MKKMDNRKMRLSNKPIRGVGLVAIIILSAIITIIGTSFVIAQGSTVTVCCEKTKSGQFCQNVPTEECAAGVTPVPTSCESTSFCKLGYCYNSNEGTCVSNTPQLVCNQNKGVWSATLPPQCDLGCCTLGDQAAFVTLTRCKKLSAFLGLNTNYNTAIKDETTCILSILGQEKGACVYESEFIKTCKLTTRADCGAMNTTTKGEFFPGKLCSAEELGTNCGPTERTICVPGKDGVYFVDTCGNPANIYDSGKLKDKEYWTNIKDVTESCNPNKENANSKTCGNCNYLLGSICREASRTNLPNYGDNICVDLNCKKTQNGKDYKHGESWCIYTDAGKSDESDNSVGSRFYKHICMNGEEVVEPCDDFRQQVCVESEIETTAEPYSQAACRVNRWRDCVVQINKEDCENLDKRDCKWIAGVPLLNSTFGACVPTVTTGLKFWEGDDAKTVCNVGNMQCQVKYSRGALGGGWDCEENCQCLSPTWQQQRGQVCQALGDCGVKTNWAGASGYKTIYKAVFSGLFGGD